MARSRPGRARGRGVDLRATGPRLALGPLTEPDLPAVEPWYNEAALRCAQVDLQLADLHRQLTQADHDERRHLLAITLHGISEPIGLLCFRADYPEPGALTIDLVVLESSHRGRGLGGEAVLTLEKEALRRRLGRRFLAPVAASQGRALYFWLRLGYRPLLRSEAAFSSVPSGIVWMARDARESAAGGAGREESGSM